MSFLFLASLLVRPAAAEPVSCQGAAPTVDEIRSASLAALTASTVLEEDEAIALTRAVEAMVTCTGDVLPSADVALLHRAAAVRDYLEGDLAGALQGLQASRALAPDARLPAGLLATSEGLVAMYATADRAPVFDPEPLVPPVGTQVHVDGAPGEVRSRSVPTVVQYADARGRVYWSRRLEAGAALPDDIPVQPPNSLALAAEAWRRARPGLSFELGFGGRSASTVVSFQENHVLDPLALTVDEDGEATIERDFLADARSDWALSRGLTPTVRAGVGVDFIELFTLSFAMGLSLGKLNQTAYYELWNDLAVPDARELVGSGTYDLHTSRTTILVLEPGVALRFSPFRGRARPYVLADGAMRLRPTLIHPAGSLHFEGTDYRHGLATSVNDRTRLGWAVLGGLGISLRSGHRVRPFAEVAGGFDSSLIGTSYAPWANADPLQDIWEDDPSTSSFPDPGYPYPGVAVQAAIGLRWHPWAERTKR